MTRDYLLAGFPHCGPLGLIATQVCAAHHVTMREVMSPAKYRAVAWVRHEIWWRCRRETGASYPAIGRAFNRDHTTVIHGVRAHQRRVDGDLRPVKALRAA